MTGCGLRRPRLARSRLRDATVAGWQHGRAHVREAVLAAADARPAGTAVIVYARQARYLRTCATRLLWARQFSANGGAVDANEPERSTGVRSMSGGQASVGSICGRPELQPKPGYQRAMTAPRVPLLSAVRTWSKW